MGKAICFFVCLIVLAVVVAWTLGGVWMLGAVVLYGVYGICVILPHETPVTLPEVQRIRFVY